MGDRQHDRVGRHWRNLGRLLCRGVLWELEVNRAWSLLPSDPEGLPHDRGDRHRADDLMRHLGQRRHRRDDVHDLKACLFAAQNAFLARDHDYRHRTELRISRTRRQVERARTKGRKADPSLAGQPSMRGCHECRRLLMAGQHQLDRRTAQRFDDVEIFFPGDPKDLLYSLVLQCGNKQVGTIH
jgi:RNase P subunit RPR2